METEIKWQKNQLISERVTRFQRKVGLPVVLEIPEFVYNTGIPQLHFVFL